MANAGSHVIIDSVPDLVPPAFSALVRGREPEPNVGARAHVPDGGPAKRYSVGGAMMDS